jgi:orotate phosphoribosyltransferase
MNWENKLFKEQVIWRYPGHGPHAVFTLSDKHSNCYFNSDYFASKTSLLEESCSYLYEQAASVDKSKPDWIITYAPYGLEIGLCLSKLFGARFGYTERDNRINFNLQAGEKVLLCADDLHTGTRMQSLIDAVTAKQVEIIGPLIFMVNYTGKTKFNNQEVLSLVNLAIETWNPNKCPLCITGSQALVAREHWQKLCSVAQSV